MILANISNGLAFPYDDVCYFQSQHGHNAKMGYFRIDAMPYKAIIHLMRGGEITIIDATRRHKKLSDALKFGVPMWCLVYNRAINKRGLTVCPWQTKEMESISQNGVHEASIHSIKKLAKYYDPQKPAIIGDNIHLQCHQGFIADDKPMRLKELIQCQTLTSIN